MMNESLGSLQQLSNTGHREAKAKIPVLDQLIHMSPTAFRDKFSLPASIRQFTRPADVWWANTDEWNEEISQKLHQDKKGGYDWRIGRG